MANSLSASFPKYWSKRMQVKHNKTDVFRKIVSMEEVGTLKRGNIVDRPYRSALVVNDLGAQGNYSRQDITDTSETLTINKEKEVSFYVREFDELQSNYETANEYADDAAVKLGNQIDGDILGEYSNATTVVDDADMGGTSGNGIALSTANIDKIFGAANEGLDAQSIEQDNRFAVISPQFYNVLWQRIGGKESMLGDKTAENGNVGSYAGFKLYKSNNLAWSGVLAYDATTVTDGDTVVINGVTLTAETGTLDAAGKWKAATDGVTCMNALAAIINNSENLEASTQGTLYYELTAANRALLKNFTATVSGGATGTVTVVATGVSYVVVSETLTPAADVWTAATQKQHQLFGRAGAIDLVIQKQPGVKFKDRDGYLGRDIVSYTLYGKKTFVEGTKALVDVAIKSSAF